MNGSPWYLDGVASPQTCQLSILIIATLRQGQSGGLAADLTPYYPLPRMQPIPLFTEASLTLTIQSITQCLSAGAMNIST